MTLTEKAANIKAQHVQRCDSRGGCDCFGRLLAAIHDQPDPYGEFYRWPIFRYGCQEPPRFGPLTPFVSLVYEMQKRTEENLYKRFNESLTLIYPPNSLDA